MAQSVENQIAILSSGTNQVLPLENLVKKLGRGKPLRVKLGMDPTAPDLHLGHAVVLNKLRQFQDLGHEILFIIGDFTARIGDPSGRSKTRPPLTKEEIEHNAKTYFQQVGRILDTKKTKVRYNAEWFAKFSLEDFMHLGGHLTLARIIERDDFQKRLHERSPIGFHELFYPLLQGYDSVHLRADVELGGSDQTFNLLMGRHLQELYGQEGQVIVTTPLLEGLDGVQKMSKSYGNYIGLAEEASSAYGKLMSISDELMWRYIELLLPTTEAERIALKAAVEKGERHPMDVKKNMAHDIVARFWSAQEAQAAMQQFEALFQKKDYSQATEVVLPVGCENPLWVVQLLKEIGAIKNSSEAKRLIDSGAVLIDDEKIVDFKASVQWRSGMILKVGKHRIYKIS